MFSYMFSPFFIFIAWTMLDTKLLMAKVDNRVHSNCPTIQITTIQLNGDNFFVSHKVLNCIFVNKEKLATLSERKLPQNQTTLCLLHGMLKTPWLKTSTVITCATLRQGTVG